MESSAVVYCNSVLGARTNTEGKESTGAAALTGRIPYWGYHITENRRGTHLVEVDVDGRRHHGLGPARLLARRDRAGRYPGADRQGRPAEPDQAQAFRRGRRVLGRRRDVPHSRRHAGSATRSRKRSAARKCEATLRYGAAERKLAYDTLNCATDRNVDFVMLGCPHNCDRAGLADRIAARWPQDQPEHPALGAHAARAARSRRAQRLRQDDHRCRRRGDERHLPGDLALRAQGHHA